MVRPADRQCNQRDQGYQCTAHLSLHSDRAAYRPHQGMTTTKPADGWGHHQQARGPTNSAARIRCPPEGGRGPPVPSPSATMRRSYASPAGGAARRGRGRAQRGRPRGGARKLAPGLPRKGSGVRPDSSEDPTDLWRTRGRHASLPSPSERPPATSRAGSLWTVAVAQSRLRKPARSSR
jgi:hypothetical protein